MKIIGITILTAILLAGCTAIPESTLAIPADVRKSSYTDDRLFYDLIVAPGGVGFANRTLYPTVTASEVTRIDVVTPYDNKRVGVEKWYVKHNTGETVCYLVKLKPDGNGGTHFSVEKK